MEESEETLFMEWALAKTIAETVFYGLAAVGAIFTVWQVSKGITDNRTHWMYQLFRDFFHTAAYGKIRDYLEEYTLSTDMQQRLLVIKHLDTQEWASA